MTIKCAKWCGRGCTEEEYNEAVTAADTLVEHLGKGWQPRVHENMGWFFSAVSLSGTVKVHVNPAGYTAYLGEAGSPGGSFTARGDTPRGAVVAVVRKAKAYVDKVSSWYAGL
jgi:hypothetical protein